MHPARFDLCPAKQKLVLLEQNLSGWQAVNVHRTLSFESWTTRPNKIPITGIGVLFGAPGKIRTCDLWLRKPTLYPAELRVLGNGDKPTVFLIALRQSRPAGRASLLLFSLKNKRKTGVIVSVLPRNSHLTCSVKSEYVSSDDRQDAQYVARSADVLTKIQ